MQESSNSDSSIDPKQLIKELSIEEFNRFSDEYYKRLPLPEYQMGKPFSMVSETAEHLRLLGYLFQILNMKPGLRTLDFGAGTGWLSKMIWQMGCPVVSLDVSQEALDLGKRLFEEFSVVYDPKVGYEFLLFDGHRIDLPDESVDRIVCYDVFHHVPNQETVMREFYRILAPGGIIGFNEPLGEHSTSVESQYEMRTYKVLENDLKIEEIAALAGSVGFGEPKFKTFSLSDLELSLEERRAVCDGEDFSSRILDHIRDSMRTSGVFCFSKGEAVADSRSAEGLAHVIQIQSEPLRFQANTQAFVEVKVTNTGTSKWLRGSPAEIGTVNVGTQLFDTEKKILAVDLTRGGLPREVLPGESVTVQVPLVVMEPGRYKIGFDLVSELVTWFHILGSEMVYLDVDVYV
ncbi:class I SAM-dependent methyltransferase [Pelagicoccus sp. SDUM812002]|uniref:class I SAM-dependent methyltransferase n=1 Tax=Pelagicoccus sp. SDUM812002 TaxID=3041266 RepID=UPI00280E5DF5|nr:class I SAM-dependent methyltransferase [Pelagicoccus sp. SDUM812002]MDQ8186385.1 class I SAM-dependent methyltransferase [Pelagicoccus sp. SDUM812002]